MLPVSLTPILSQIKMKLSLVVVNHNNGHLFKQGLTTLVNACFDIDYELIIVDNASADQSLEVIRQEYPFANIITNNFNLGIAKANNQGLKAASGEYVLMVRPDTISTMESITRMLDFMEQHSKAAGLSPRILSPQGRFMPESVHGLTPSWAAFIKFIGFAKNLPKTRLYDRNRKDWVEEFRIAEVDILNDACMLIRRSVLNQTGYFDERFSRFGYNIDLSYRMRIAGFKNYYFPKTYFIQLDQKPFSLFDWKIIKYNYGAMLNVCFKVPGQASGI